MPKKPPTALLINSRSLLTFWRSIRQVKTQRQRLGLIFLWLAKRTLGAESVAVYYPDSPRPRVSFDRAQEKLN